MEVRVEQVAIPEKIAFNYEELKQELSNKVKMYETLVYTDDQIKNAKADRADLNRLKKALNDERIRREKEYMRPFNAFKTQINEIIGIIDNPVALIDKQIKAYEENRKSEKKQNIYDYWRVKYLESHISSENLFGEEPRVLFEEVFDEKWLNSSASMKSIQESVDTEIATIENEFKTLSDLPEFAFEAIETYKTTLDLNRSIAEGHRLSEIQKRKAEQERIKAEQEKASAEQEEERARLAAMVTPEEIAENEEAYREAANVGGVHMSEELSMQYQAKEEVAQSPKEMPTYVCFKALLTVPQALELKEFFESRNIEFSRIQGGYGIWQCRIV